MFYFNKTFQNLFSVKMTKIQTYRKYLPKFTTIIEIIN